MYLHTYISIYIFSEHTLAPWDFVHESEHRPLKFTACINIILGVNTLETFSLWQTGWCFGNSWSAVLVGCCWPSLWHNEYASAKYDTRKPSIFAFSILSSFSLLLWVMLIMFLPLPQKGNSFCAMDAQNNTVFPSRDLSFLFPIGNSIKM